MIDYIPEKLFKLDSNFIKENIDEIIWIEDYIPFNINYQSEVYEMNPQKVYPNTLLAEYLNYKIQMIEED